MYQKSNLDDPALLISVSELHKLAKSGEDIFLLDVRTRPEVEANRLAFTSLAMPYDSIQFKLDLLPQDRETTIYCFCRTGRRSGTATRYLRSLGYKNAFNVAGGIVAWQELGHPTVSGEM